MDRRVVLVLVLTAQFLVPAHALTQERPARLGWQMFAASRPAPAIVAVTADGSEVEMRAAGFIGRYRPEVSYESLLGPHICELRDDVELVILQRGERRVVHRC